MLNKIIYLGVGVTSIILAIMVVILFSGTAVVFWGLMVATGFTAFGVSVVQYSVTTILYPDELLPQKVSRERLSLLLAATGVSGYMGGTGGVLTLYFLLAWYGVIQTTR